jgi:hypothetical protein
MALKKWQERGTTSIALQRFKNTDNIYILKSV